ncbi:MAG: Ig-like domain-containing protein, partial [Planctomycetota bacterium]|nr:Ig-like domain-containing protein [Planctomycetota bacterium]
MLIRVEPADAESAVARNVKIRLTFSTQVLPQSVHDLSLQVRTGGTFQTRPDGQFLVSGNIVEFDPTVLGNGGENAIGFPSGSQILVKIPLFDPDAPEPHNLFLQNIEGNPIRTTAQDNEITFITGFGWNDPVQGPPGVLGLEFVPEASPIGLVQSDAAVTVIFNEPIDPSSVLLGGNIFLTNNSPTSPTFQQDIPSLTFFDGSLRRYTFLPVFGFGQGPFKIQLNFIDPDAPTTFNPNFLPTDLAGNKVQNFTFLANFGTEFDPSTQNIGLINEDFTTTVNRDSPNTTAFWGDDTQLPFTLIGAGITTRTATININSIIRISGGNTAIRTPTVPPPPGTFYNGTGVTPPSAAAILDMENW